MHVTCIQVGKRAVSLEEVAPDQVTSFLRAAGLPHYQETGPRPTLERHAAVNHLLDLGHLRLRQVSEETYLLEIPLVTCETLVQEKRWTPGQCCAECHTPGEEMLQRLRLPDSREALLCCKAAALF